jgi:hypothetical protein
MNSQFTPAQSVTAMGENDTFKFHQRKDLMTLKINELCKISDFCLRTEI